MKHLGLQGLFGHLCASPGLYSKETFLTLYGCITRLVRDYHLSGIVLTCTLDDPDFETMTHALDDIPNLPLYRLPSNQDRVGCLLMLTNRLCAGLFWSAASQDAFRMYEGGWTFHPGDTRTMTTQLLSRMKEAGFDVEDKQKLLEEVGIDRRYDDKLNILTISLVRGLEHRNRELVMALDQVQTLNKRNVDTERLAAIGQLSSAIAHEIRNPLGLIDLYAKLTEDRLAKVAESLGEQKDPLLKNLALIRQATTSLEGILSELTQYSRPLKLNLQITNIVQLVSDVCEFYQPSYAQKEVLLTVVPPDADIEPIKADGERIRQALINLLKNALEATKPSKRVTVSVAYSVSANHLGHPPLHVTVRDEGSGVSPENMAKLFTPYFSTKGNEGTGLGLAHSRKIMQAHGGSVELLRSIPNEGSTFALILPTDEAEIPLPEPLVDRKISMEQAQV
jgi:signal transduction histidine kinase